MDMVSELRLEVRQLSRAVQKNTGMDAAEKRR
mgnify:FL=1